jgi:hypothetical protein
MILKLDARQEAILIRYKRDKFIAGLMNHHVERDTGLVTRIEPSRRLEFFRKIVDNAQAFGFNDYEAVYRYTDLTLALGWHFESDPQYPWVLETCERLKPSGDALQAEELAHQMKAEIAATHGPYRVEAIRGILEGNLMTLPLREEGFVRGMTGCLHAAWPQKVEYIGATVMENACAVWQAKAREEFRITQPETQALMILSFYMLGHDFLHHPLYAAWATPAKLEEARRANEWAVHTTLQAGLRRSLEEELTGIRALKP